ncbi:uncharacterized protein EDB91DRAFT_1245396 [Suillus paluster]|uniref:uncharacterized protein n=1 Tax=Suillus paluster TaxID=48578 RepID=UPI001B871FEB|nr:uncharacterized protein EDB91DRAFT_1245396 [Suillus paluster]KAG1747923.1 hypothetical protein EDB91DRAFT_1245396 [Suillus paluster]
MGYVLGVVEKFPQYILLPVSGDEEGTKEADAEEGSDDKDEDEGSGSGDEDVHEEGHELEDAEDDEGGETRDPLSTEYLIDDNIADEMDEFGYTGLDQVLVEDEDNNGLLDDDALGAEDGEELEGGLNYDEAEGIGFADL